jgi:hypothetical protein
MQSLIWKECHENFRWAALALLPVSVLAYATVSHPNALTMISPHYLFLMSVVAAIFGGTLGFLQVFAESRGDRRALLVHRPLSPTRIFLGKALAGLGLYVPVVGLPFAFAVGWNAMPGHGASPFRWPLALPWLADILTGVVYYFAAMLAAQRNTPWYGSRGLGVATAFACSLIVHLVSEFGYALLAIAVTGALLGVAAWGSFVTGGAYSPQRRIAKTALAVTLLIGLMVAGTAAINLPTFALEILGPDNRRIWYEVDGQGRVLIVRQDRRGQIESVTDLAGNEPPELRGQRVDQRTIEELATPLRLLYREPDFLGYRSFDRICVPIENESSSTAELWYYVHDQALLMGYEQRSKRLVGSLGPGGFVPPHERPAERFQGQLFTPYGNRGNDSPDYLTFPGGVYTVDFAQRTI